MGSFVVSWRVPRFIRSTFHFLLICAKLSDFLNLYCLELMVNNWDSSKHFFSLFIRFSDEFLLLLNRLKKTINKIGNLCVAFLLGQSLHSLHNELWFFEFHPGFSVIDQLDHGSLWLINLDKCISVHQTDLDCM